MFLRLYRQKLSIKYCLTGCSCLCVPARECMSLRVLNMYVPCLRASLLLGVVVGVGVCLEGWVKHALCYGHVSKFLPESHEI
jgi:hypothetical protein